MVRSPIFLKEYYEGWRDQVGGRFSSYPEMTANIFFGPPHRRGIFRSEKILK